MFATFALAFRLRGAVHVCFPFLQLYRIQNPQAPLVQNDNQSAYGYDEYPNGCNAVVAVISYTGFDMEDAMIINKSSFERGFGHASVYKTIVSGPRTLPRTCPKLLCLRTHAFLSKLTSRTTTSATSVLASSICPTSDLMAGTPLEDSPALPTSSLIPWMTMVCPLWASSCSMGIQSTVCWMWYVLMPLCSVPCLAVHSVSALADVQVTGRPKITNHKDLEPAYVDQVRLLGTDNKSGKPIRASIKIRYNRNPVVGDKFSSRHGQKGVLSVLWPQQVHALWHFPSGVCLD